MSSYPLLGASEDDADSATRAAREDTKKEIETMLAAVYQHGHEELYAPVEQNCVSILAKLRETSDDDADMSERKRARISRREQDILERVRIACLFFVQVLTLCCVYLRPS